MCLFLSDNGQSVSQWQYYLLDPIVASHKVVELLQADGLQVAFAGLFCYAPIPQGVVCQNVTSRFQSWQNHFIVFYVLPFVCIYEGHVPHDVHLRNEFFGITDMDMHKFAIGTAFYPRAGEVFHFVKDLESVKFGAFVQSFCHT